MDFTLHCGDNRDILRSLPDNSIDSIVTDPPYELGFMGKKWDSTGIAYDVTLWAECLRVLKPGGHLIAFGGTRTYHRMTVAIEDAGFEIRDCIQWIYGSGFPKSHDVSKAIDRQAGAEREVVVESKTDMFGEYDITQSYYGATQSGVTNGFTHSDRIDGRTKVTLTAPHLDAAKAWHGWGTALKPANEPAVLARKPLTGTVADNVMTWGVGAINVDGCRIATDDNLNGGSYGNTTRDNDNYFNGKKPGGAGVFVQPSGRWPANVIFDEEAAQVLDGQSGHSVSGSHIRHNTQSIFNAPNQSLTKGNADAGGASRFFYVAKASRSEREAGLDAPDGERGNIHTTVKPIDLMRYLVRLVTPKGGTVLDPFMGSGSTGCAAMREGMDFVGIDITPEYVEIARRRIVHHANQNPMGL